MSDDLKATFAHHLRDFEDLHVLKNRLLYVLQSLPNEVQQDFLHDPRFSVAKDNYQRGRGSTVFMACPGSHSERSRSVVLKPLLAECSEAFAHYVIAHEFAHAFLHNGPWGKITDVEEAADALAAHWGIRASGRYALDHAMTALGARRLCWWAFSRLPPPGARSVPLMQPSPT